ncbi:alpha/beta fold hydrolase [Nocardia terpenica]|uniref:AB hydrolase-1 domain-containing protein n=1 Tax=Nocardia terpenica TaxID=455432 RepID=A0A291RFW7_9NOCA|nr:alpha/beta hydrolase [Nocardia terpenica]ATL66188.1 hypothetical protein CRH09_08245 [Nocardia terpenica]
MTTAAGIAVVERGEGAPVVLLHGGLGTHVTWLPFVDVAGNGLRFFLFDSPGHGGSDPLDAPLTYSLAADRVAAAIAELGLDRPLVGGWSDGGQIALELAVRHPGTAGALIVGGAYPRFDRGGIRDKHRMLLGANRRNEPNLEFLDYCLGEEGPTIKGWHPGGEPQWRRVVEDSANMWLTYEGLSDEQLAGIDIPVLVLGADQDELVGPEMTVELFRALSAAELAIIPGSDHDAIRTPTGAPRFVAPFRAFIGRVAAAQSR